MRMNRIRALVIWTSGLSLAGLGLVVGAALLAVLDSAEFRAGQPHTELVGEVIARKA